jgi:predicted enzyme related to lactoylglutathione lyase
MPPTHLFARMPVRDLGAAIGWYERLTGRAPDLIPNEREAAWRITDAAWIYVELDAEHAGSGLVTLLVEDLDGSLTRVHERGIRAGSVQQIGQDVRQAVLTDPDGNRVKLGQPPAR